MLRLLLAVLFVATVFAIEDPICTSDNVYSPNAVACSNVLPDDSCDVLYPNTTVAVGSSKERPFFCYNDTLGRTEDRKQIAIDTCPKTCGFCCLKKGYDCPNAESPRINCNTITPTMCQDPDWREVIATDCPSACGFCDLDGCIDNDPDCYLQPDICFIEELQPYAAKNCRRTCGLCGTSYGSSTYSPDWYGSSSFSSCSDIDPKCDLWVQNGLCSSVFYTDEQKKELCPRSCGLC